jgi:NTE family protein
LERVVSIASEQVGAVRKRWLIDQYVSKTRLGGLWAINTNIEDYGLPSAPSYGPEVRRLLAKVRTDLNSFSYGEIACLENHGYSLSDAAIKSRAPHLVFNPAAKFMWHHPKWSADAEAMTALQNSGSRQVVRDTGHLFTGAFKRRKSSF